MRLHIGRPVRLICIFISLLPIPRISAVDRNDTDQNDYDAYTIRVDGFWFYAHPTAHFTGANNSGSFDLNTDVNFQTYSTFVGRVDWKFTRKNRLYFEVTPFDQTKMFTAIPTIVFKGQTYVVGATVSANLTSDAYVSGVPVRYFRAKAVEPWGEDSVKPARY